MILIMERANPDIGRTPKTKFKPWDMRLTVENPNCTCRPSFPHCCGPTVYISLTVSRADPHSEELLSTKSLDNKVWPYCTVDKYPCPETTLLISSLHNSLDYNLSCDLKLQFKSQRAWWCPRDWIMYAKKCGNTWNWWRSSEIDGHTD